MQVSLLREWSSNSAVLTELLQKNEDCCADAGGTVGVLGLEWNMQEDNIVFHVKPIKGTALTKRTIVAEISKIFDPLGFLLPVTIRGRIMIQELWKKSLVGINV